MCIKRSIIFFVLLLPSLLLIGCETAGPKTELGGLGGAAAGGLLAAVAGGKAEGIAAGVILGGLLGGAIGGELDRRDREEASRAAQQAFENSRAGTSVAWRNPDSGNSGTVTPTRTYQRDNGQYCREYQQSVRVGGRDQESFGTACRQPDGNWKIVN